PSRVVGIAQRSVTKRSSEFQLYARSVARFDAPLLRRSLEGGVGWDPPRNVGYMLAGLWNAGPSWNPAGEGLNHKRNRKQCSTYANVSVRPANAGVTTPPPRPTARYPLTDQCGASA